MIDDLQSPAFLSTPPQAIRVSDLVGISVATKQLHPL